MKANERLRRMYWRTVAMFIRMRDRMIVPFVDWDHVNEYQMNAYTMGELSAYDIWRTNRNRMNG